MATIRPPETWLAMPALVLGTVVPEAVLEVLEALESVVVEAAVLLAADELSVEVAALELPLVVVAMVVCE
jgi:hypothetical protein